MQTTGETQFDNDFLPVPVKPANPFKMFHLVSVGHYSKRSGDEFLIQMAYLLQFTFAALIAAAAAGGNTFGAPVTTYAAAPYALPYAAGAPLAYASPLAYNAAAYASPLAYNAYKPVAYSAVNYGALPYAASASYNSGIVKPYSYSAYGLGYPYAY